MLTCADIVAVQLEKIQELIPKMFPMKKVMAYGRYRYSWEKKWRTLPLDEWVVSDGAYEYFLNITDEKRVRDAMGAVLKRYHWTDRAGRVRRVKQFEVFLQP